MSPSHIKKVLEYHVRVWFSFRLRIRVRVRVRVTFILGLLKQWAPRLLWVFGLFASTTYYLMWGLYLDLLF